MTAFTRRAHIARILVFLGAAVFLPGVVARAHVSVVKRTLTAETRVGPPLVVPANTSLPLRLNTVVLGEELAFQTPPLRDAGGAPVPDFGVEFVLTAPSGATHTLIGQSNSQGVVQITIPAAYLNEIGSYQIRTRGQGMPTFIQSFLVLKKNAGPVTVGPNPFSPSDPVYHEVRFVFPEARAGSSHLKIFRLDGIKVFESDFQAGQEPCWPGVNDRGEFIRGGVYLWQITAAGKRYTGTVVVVR